MKRVRGRSRALLLVATLLLSAVAVMPAIARSGPAFQAQELMITAIPVLQFDRDTINVTAGGSVTVHFVNDEANILHNFAAYTDSSATTPLAAGSVGAICDGPCANDVQFDVSAAGSYYFRCDVHPFMDGQFIVQELPTPTPTVGETPMATPTAAATPGQSPTTIVPPDLGQGSQGDASGERWSAAALAIVGFALVALGAVALRHTGRAS